MQRIFNALKRNDTISHSVFRRTFLPANAPMMLSKKLFEIYAINHSRKEINFEDFAELNYLIKMERQSNRTPNGTQGASKNSNKKAILCFYFFK